MECEVTSVTRSTSARGPSGRPAVSAPQVPRFRITQAPGSGGEAEQRVEGVGGQSLEVLDAVGVFVPAGAAGDGPVLAAGGSGVVEAGDGQVAGAETVGLGALVQGVFL